MMGPTHRLFGLLAGAGVASLSGQDLPMVVMTGLVATATSNGWSSPDVDQHAAWVKAGRVPGPQGSLFTHRYGLAHWWGLPLLVWWFGVRPMPDPASTIAVALLVGWGSHLFGDFLFGRLALLPWGGPRFGLGLRTDGFAESGKWRGRTVLPFAPARLLIVGALGWVLWALPRTHDVEEVLALWLSR